MKEPTLASSAGHARERKWAFLPVNSLVLHAAGGECEECEKKNREIQRKRGIGSESAGIPAVVHEVLRSPGWPLDAEARSFMEPRFGHDFSQVRVHTGSRAAESARAVNALAYTVGKNIVFGAGQHAPETSQGRELLAHELTHVVQQSGASAGGGLILDGSASAEREAETMARSAVHSEPLASPRNTVDAGLQRQPLPADMRDLDAPHGPRTGHRHGAASQFLECVAEKGEANRQTCREEHLGVPACPATHTIPDDVYDAIGKAWMKSGHGGKTVTEHGGRIVTDKDAKRVIRTGSGGGGSISLPAEKTGDVTLGSFHTHPYSKAEKSHLGVSFSGGDISNFVDGDQGSVKYVGSGTCYFVLDTGNAAKRDACKTQDLKKRWNDSFAKASGSFQAKVETAVKDTIAGCGLCYYKTCRPDNKSPVPKTASLA